MFMIIVSCIASYEYDRDYLTIHRHEMNGIILDVVNPPQSLRSP